MSDHLFALRLFTRVARRGSFSAASRELGLPQSTASRTIADLENRIGAKLLVRSTRAVTLSDAGVDFLARIEPLLAELGEAEEAARGRAQLKGSLRIGVSSSMAVREIIPRLPRFIAQHEALMLDIRIDDQRQDLVTEGIDVAFRFGLLADSTATAIPIRSWPIVLVAAPSYLSRRGKPAAPADLATHDLVLGPMNGSSSWTFKAAAAVGTQASLNVDGRHRVNGNEGAIAAAVAGLGITMMRAGAVRRETHEGRLVQVLPSWDLGSSQLSAVFPGGRGSKRAARALADFLITDLTNWPDDTLDGDV